MSWARAILRLAALGCGPDPTGEDTGGEPAETGFDYGSHALVPFETNLIDGFLCADAEAPEQAADVQFIDCTIEGENDRDPAPVDDLLVMAWNIERGQRIESQLTAFTDGSLPAPDILLLSEADRGCPRSGGGNVTMQLAQALDMNWAYAVEFVELPRGGSDVTCEHGNAVLSRYPLANVSQIRHAENLSWYDNAGEPRLGGRIAVAADVVVAERSVHVVTVHFESDISVLDVQVAQAVETAEHAAAQPFGVIVGGDTNAPYYTFDLLNGAGNDETIGAFLDRGFTDTHGTLDPTDRGTLSGLVIDVMLGRDVDVAEPGICDVALCGGLSDHQAVWATVSLP
jgi:endonuclease/exonuclease/phosphatase family metal-dependent hydrolase